MTLKERVAHLEICMKLKDDIQYLKNKYHEQQDEIDALKRYLNVAITHTPTIVEKKD